MVVVTERHLPEAAEQYPDAANDLSAWYAAIRSARFHNFLEVREMFPDADAVNGYVILNIRRNRYLLITVIHYSRMSNGVETKGHIYVRSFLTHRQYDNRNNWDRRFGQ
jgi:mRNA interferase HigB